MRPGNSNNSSSSSSFSSSVVSLLLHATGMACLSLCLSCSNRPSQDSNSIEMEEQENPEQSLQEDNSPSDPGDIHWERQAIVYLLRNQSAKAESIWVEQEALSDSGNSNPEKKESLQFWREISTLLGQKRSPFNSLNSSQINKWKVPQHRLLWQLLHAQAQELQQVKQELMRREKAIATLRSRADSIQLEKGKYERLFQDLELLPR